MIIKNFEINKINNGYKKNTLVEIYEKILISIQPIIPHFSNECLEMLNKNNFKWPEIDESIIQDDTINLVIQINGKKRGLIQTKFNSTEDELVQLLKYDIKIMKYLDNKEIKKKIYIKNKLLNIII